MPNVAANINKLPKGDGQGAYFARALHNMELLRRKFGLPVVPHWKVCLPVTGLAFVMMLPDVIAAEKRGKMKAGQTRAIGLILIGPLLLGDLSNTLLSNKRVRSG